mmetsp:Transcript_17933/g.27155  ORF Transcript_17933/g.27155 Transcript_17933/m.27155 type:complete len:120 (+) Transcript_17933:216-575(+)
MASRITARPAAARRPREKLLEKYPKRKRKRKKTSSNNTASVKGAKKVCKSQAKNAKGKDSDDDSIPVMNVSANSVPMQQHSHASQWIILPQNNQQQKIIWNQTVTRVTLVTLHQYWNIR